MTIETRRLGRTGADVTILGYGAMELRGQPHGPVIADEDAGRLLNEVLDSGINLIDTSIDYGRSEELIGRYLGHRRDEYFLASKCGCLLGPPPPGARPPFPHDYSAANVRAGIEQSLRRLGTDHLDLVQVHMSPSRDQMAAEQTIETLMAVREEGKTRFLGMSGILPNLPDHIAMGVFDVFQIPYSVVQREHEDLITAAARPRRGPAPVGVRRAGRPARRHAPAGVRAALHAQPPGPVQHDRRHLQPRAPARQPGRRRQGTAARGPVRGGQEAPWLTGHRPGW